jgi:hypothetical protein
MNLLHPKTALILILLTLFLVVPGRDISAETTINCHCFQDRTYNPAAPRAADDYILATSFNSFLSRWFAVPKKEIVMLKMKEGVGQDDLLVGLQIARTTGIDLQQLLGQRRQGLAWSAIINDLVSDETIKKSRLLETIEAGLPVKEVGAGIADQLIGEFYAVPEATIQEFRQNGLNAKEMTLVLILAHARDQKAAALMKQHTKQGRSWSAIANSLGIEPVGTGKLILQYPARQLPE